MSKKIEKISSTLFDVLRRRGLSSRLKEYRLFGRWEKIVGREIALHAMPRSVRGNRLTLIVDSSVWGNELSLRRPEIIEKINRSLGRGAIEQIVLRIGEPPASHSKDANMHRPVVSLSSEERDKIASYVSGLADPGVRETLSRVMEKDFIARKSKA